MALHTLVNTLFFSHTFVGILMVIGLVSICGFCLSSGKFAGIWGGEQKFPELLKKLI